MCLSSQRPLTPVDSRHYSGCLPLPLSTDLQIVTIIVGAYPCLCLPPFVTHAYAMMGWHCSILLPGSLRSFSLIYAPSSFWANWSLQRFRLPQMIPRGPFCMGLSGNLWATFRALQLHPAPSARPTDDKTGARALLGLPPAPPLEAKHFRTWGRF